MYRMLGLKGNTSHVRIGSKNKDLNVPHFYIDQLVVWCNNHAQFMRDNWCITSSISITRKDCCSYERKARMYGQDVPAFQYTISGRPYTT